MSAEIAKKPVEVEKPKQKKVEPAVAQPVAHKPVLEVEKEKETKKATVPAVDASEKRERSMSTLSEFLAWVHRIIPNFHNVTAAQFDAVHAAYAALPAAVKLEVDQMAFLSGLLAAPTLAAYHPDVESPMHGQTEPQPKPVAKPGA